MMDFLASRIRGTASVGPGTPPPRLAAFYWHYVRQTRFWYGVMTATVLSVALMDMAVPVMLGQITALVQAPDPAAALQARWPILALLAAGILFLRPLLQVMDVAVRNNILLPGTTNLVRWQSHWHVVRQSWPFFQNDFAGRIANRVMQTANALRESVMSSIRAVLFITIYGISSLVLMFWADWRLAVPTAIWIACYVFFVRFFVPRLLVLSKVASEQRSILMARIVDSYTNILTVKLFARAVDEDAHVREAVDDHQAAIAAHMRIMSFYLFTLNVMNALLIAGTAGIGIALWAQGAVSAALVATAVPLAWQIANMSGWVSFEIAGIFENMGVVQEGMQSIAVPHTLVDAADAKNLQVSRGEIHFDAVDFSYAGGRRVLERLELRVRPGERVGIVGRSGAGKSTLINLLLRFYEVDGGAITIDGQDLRQVTQESLRGAIGVVTQDTSLLHRSIADNIRYGRPEATDAEVEAAARQAHAHEFITGLVDWQGRTGYAAHVGERGVKLSGGQRQRIAIARVILKNAPILILDEATSALDSEVEVAIQEQLLGLMEGKTVIAIAHRLSTIARMDRLIVLDQGRIVEQGSHAQLLALNGRYAALWHHQSGGFLPDELPSEEDQAPEDDQDAAPVRP
ncbi:MAG: ABC transporter ATP-binding protein/permease [Cellvibrionaceae bacterium]|nr:ABC transporter ATP-binding protein/permease [Cellvibrionaceae bacterium]